MKKLLALLLVLMASTGHGATITPGYVFTTNEQVTASKLGTLVSGATISGISGADFSDGAITGAKLGADSVTTDKVLDGTLLGTDLASRTLTSGLFGTNSVDGTAASTNFVWKVGSVMTYTNGSLFFNNAALSINFTNSVLGFSSGQIPVAAVSGAAGLSSLVSSNLTGYSYASGGGYTWSTILSLTTTFTTGSVHLVARALIAPSQSHTVFMRIVDTGNTVEGSTAAAAIGGASATPYKVDLYDTLTGSTKTYNWQVATSSTATTFTNTHATGVGGTSGFTNELGMTIFQAK